ncbi:malonyl CoA-acyl carrier protein transacylase isoform X2 [Macadamia integrifolia]|uniref:malonyl CoA-acyl carrier protein transacylase isoform X1 n=1 Tax=Macadamia integrifolia TaxID=60698 RepID=UPI001C4FF9C3|nr:malonyl CoA-acyl carrier protein transacylase isoform X1 [Macadamia integrifolia]XP_042512458.1 malonyl CoA-acyl carrier protein transacylase isoform X2 [Macadamia integrifolia]
MRSHFILNLLTYPSSYSLHLILSLTPSSSIPKMSSITLPPVLPVRRISFNASESLKSCNSSTFMGSRHGIRIRGFSSENLDKSRFCMSVSVGSRTVVDDALFFDYKPSCAFLFPGQGAQAVGMGVEAQNVPAAANLYKKANDILGFDLLDVCTNGPKEKLNSTVISQPAIYVTSLAAVEIIRAREGGQQIIDSVDVTCGLSLGEYTALAFAGAFGFEDGLKLVKLRGEAMQEAADAAQSAMVSVIGLDSEKVQLLCDAANEEVDEENKVLIANFLCPGNYAVSGGVKGVEALEAKAKSFKARMTVRLAVAGAFHTSFMEPAVSRLEAALAATEVKIPRIPVISNVDAQPHADPDTIKKILARQVTSPVQWETTVKNLLAKGLKKSYELGPGKVIAGIIKRIDKSAAIENIGA